MCKHLQPEWVVSGMSKLRTTNSTQVNNWNDMANAYQGDSNPANVLAMSKAIMSLLSDAQHEMTFDTDTASNSLNVAKLMLCRLMDAQEPKVDNSR